MPFLISYWLLSEKKSKLELSISTKKKEELFFLKEKLYVKKEKKFFLNLKLERYLIELFLEYLHMDFSLLLEELLKDLFTSQKLLTDTLIISTN